MSGSRSLTAGSSCRWHPTVSHKAAELGPSGLPLTHLYQFGGSYFALTLIHLKSQSGPVLGFGIPQVAKHCCAGRAATETCFPQTPHTRCKAAENLTLGIYHL